MKDKIVNILKVVVSLGLIAYLLSRVELSEIAASVRAANGWYLLLAVVLFFGAISSHALKWFILMRAQKIRIPFRAVLGYTLVGFFFNNFLPANVGGDLMRGYGLARHIERTAEAAVSVVVDRIVGFIAFMSAAVVATSVAVFIVGRNELQNVEIAAVIGLVAIAGGFVVILSRRVRRWLERFFEWPLLKPLAPIYGKLSTALSAYRHSYSSLILAYFTSLFTLVLTNFTDYCIAQALGGGLPLLYIFVFNPIIAFVLLVPISVGGLGVTQSAYVFFYGLVGVSAPFTLTLSLIKQAIIYLTSVPGGLLWWRGRSSARSAAVVEPTAAVSSPEPRG